MRHTAEINLINRGFGERGDVTSLGFRTTALYFGSSALWPWCRAHNVCCFLPPATWNTSPESSWPQLPSAPLFQGDPPQELQHSTELGGPHSEEHCIFSSRLGEETQNLKKKGHYSPLSWFLLGSRGSVSECDTSDKGSVAAWRF